MERASNQTTRLEVISHRPEDTQAIGRALGEHAGPGDVVLLVGELGSGKTCLTQGLLWGLGGREYARSPTFVIVSQYEGRLPLYHVDLYRVDRAEEIDDLGLDEYLLGDGVCVVEWAEKAPGIYPRQHVKVDIKYLDEASRRLTITAKGSRYDRAMEAVKSLGGT